MIINCSKDSQAASYLVSRDGGAVGVHRLGLYFEEFSFVTSMVFVLKAGFLSSTMTATVSIGGMEPGTGNIFPDYYFTPKVITNPVFFVPFQMDVPDNRRTPQALELILFVGVQPLTSGELIVCTDYFNTDI